MDGAEEHNIELIHKKKIKLIRNHALEKQSLIMSGSQFIKIFFGLLKTFPLEDEAAKKAVIRTYMEEVLHVIFFFGHMHVMPINPKEFFRDEEYERLKKILPAPFEKYKTHLPTRTPYSVLLEVVVKMNNPNNVNRILQQLTDINKALQKPTPTDKQLCSNNDYSFDSTVVSFSYFQDPVTNKRSENFFGASLGCKGRVERQIMIAISCIKVWNMAVAYAVHYARQERCVHFPDFVYSEAFKSGRKNNGPYKKLAPCRKCFRSFQNVKFVPAHEELNYRADWPNGNCAEAESLSKLLDKLPNVMAMVCSVVNGTKTLFTPDMMDFKASCQNTASQKLKSRNFEIMLDWQFFSCNLT
ncbi:uncharacterized protein LOC122799251 isoform X1 [Protopterus annectens]|uniref:uncharacterized protein LOC122799251 isoform X1 n=1 Tax=Protopterus annectens TaxID=7888 RepID=UPI001CFA5565|nr:uncharacterized protein LOC122799251 isoform X1 [Protopterus annectens]